MDIASLAIIAGVLYLFSSYQYSRLNYSVVKSAVKKWDIDGVLVYTDIAVNNGTDIPLWVDGFDGSILYRGQELAKVGLINKLSISPRSEGTITVGAKILYGPSTVAIIEAIRDRTIESKITLKGTLYAGKVKLPISTSYQLW